MKSLTIRVFASTVLAMPVLAQATSWTVDDDGPADFNTIQGAVDAASSGDTVLVREGSYGPVDIDGKGLRLVAQGDVSFGGIFIFGPGLPSLSIRNLQADERLSMRGFTIGGGVEYYKYNVEITDNLGAVVLEHCEFAGSGNPFLAIGCASLTMANCRIQAPPTYVSTAGQFFLGIVPYTGLRSIDSNLYLYDSEFFGSIGSPSSAGVVFGGFVDHPAGEGGDGAGISGGTLLASGCRFVGGNGGPVFLPDCYSGVSGGSGLAASGSAGSFRLIDCEFSAGFGTSGTCGNPSGATPPELDVSPGDVVNIPGTARSFDVDSPVLEATATTLRLAGEPGDAVTVFFATEYAPALYFPDIAVAAHLPLPALLLAVGRLPASGVLDLPVTLPGLASPLDSFTFTGQAIFLDGFSVRDGGPASLTVLGAGL